MASSIENINVLHFRSCVGKTDKINLLEEFKILLLNRGNRVLGFVNISQGGMTGTVADPKLIFVAALKAAASYIILVHNHPSEQLQPSGEDIRLTKKLVEAGKLLDILVVDHLIITKDGYYSFCDEGLTFERFNSCLPGKRSSQLR